MQDSVLPFLLNSKARRKNLSRRFLIVLLSQVDFTTVEGTSGVFRASFLFAQPILVCVVHVTQVHKKVWLNNYVMCKTYANSKRIDIRIEDNT